jgi:hypothetical protein
MRKLLLPFLLATSVPAMAQSYVGHVHTASCNHQSVDDQGTLTLESSSLYAPQQSLGSSIVSGGMTFVLNDLGGVGVGTQARAGFEAAAAMWSKFLKDPITINLDVKFSTLGPNILGSTGSTTNTINYGGLAQLLAADAKSIFDQAAVASLQGGTALTFVSNEPPVSGAIDSTLRFLDNNGSFDNLNNNINTAQVKALGLNPVYNPTTNAGGRDGSVSFSDAFSWDFDPSDGITAGSFDFVGVAAHEIGHALGFRSGVDTADVNALPGVALPGRRGLNNIAWGTVNDLYRYGSFNGSQTLDWSVGGTPCYSLNAGRNCIALLSTGSLNGDLRQASHWKDDTLLNISPPIGIMDPTASGPGSVRPLMKISKYDLIAFDAMGYDLAVPEPASWAMMIAGFGMIGGALRRRRFVSAPGHA